MITENGGKIVGIDEPKLTHVVVDKRDDSRRVALMSRTSKFVAIFAFDLCNSALRF